MLTATSTDGGAIAVLEGLLDSYRTEARLYQSAAVTNLETIRPMLSDVIEQAQHNFPMHNATGIRLALAEAERLCTLAGAARDKAGLVERHLSKLAEGHA